MAKLYQRGDRMERTGIMSKIVTTTLISLVVGATVQPLSAQPARGGAPEEGIFVLVPHPITSDVVARVRNQVDEARSEKHGRVVSKVIFDFNPNGRESASTDFGPCLDLARYIRGLHNLVTVAYVHNKVSRHSVLPVLACQEVVMGEPTTSWLGRVVENPANRLDRIEREAYDQLAGEPRLAIVRKMYDPNVELMRGRRQNATIYFDNRQIDDATRGQIVGAEMVLPAGEILFANTEFALQLGLCQLGYKTQRRQLLEVYGLSPSSLRGDLLRGQTPVARIVPLRGEIGSALRESLMRRLYRARDEGVNTFFLVFQDFGGGNLSEARNLADELIKFTTDETKPVQVIAFIPDEASGPATFVAVSCSEIAMSEGATLGDFTGWLQATAENAPNIVASLQQVFEQRDLDPLIVEGMLNKDVELFFARTAKGRLERRLMTGADLKADQQRAEPSWQVEKQIKHAGTYLVLSAEMARELGVARHVVATKDVREVVARYGLGGSDVRELSPDWLDQIADFLRLPGIRFLLVMIGITCLILEFKIPGATAPGVIAAVCFVLFFWAQSHLSGQIIILAILLFLLGLILIGIEVFVIPGFGFVGISGILLVVIGLGLATVDRAPRSAGEWLNLGATVTQFGLGMMGATFLAIILARYLPHIPGANRLFLPPPGEGDNGDEPAPLPGVEEAAALLGAIGTAATVLRPAGMARFGDQYVDVITEGTFVPAGARVQVIEVEGNRIVVKEV
jgi:membrane-bound ClpP family serine protease